MKYIHEPVLKQPDLAVAPQGRIRLLWIGEHLCLVKWPGGGTGGTFSDYVSSWVDLVDREGVGMNRNRDTHMDRRVWDSSAEEDGPLTAPGD